MRAQLLSTILLGSLIFSSCVSTVGPEGPAGRDGRDGHDGDDGQVEIYNGTFTVDSDIDFGIVDEYVSVASYAWGILDEVTVDEGLVLAYIRFEGSTAWHSLPLSTPFENDIVVLRYSFDIDNFDLIVEGEVANNNELNEDLFDGDTIRVIAIPPSMMLKGKNIDYNNYEQVKTLYELTD